MRRVRSASYCASCKTHGVGPKMHTGCLECGRFWRHPPNRWGVQRFPKGPIWLRCLFGARLGVRDQTCRLGVLASPAPGLYRGHREAIDQVFRASLARRNARSGFPFRAQILPGHPLRFDGGRC